VGLSGDIDTLTTALAAHGGRVINLPASLPVARNAARAVVAHRLGDVERKLLQLRQDLDALSGSFGLAASLSQIQRLQWFLAQVSTLPVTENFAWLTGWSSDPDGGQLRAALRKAGVHAIIEYTTPAHETQAPLVLQNPWWARPFELFARMLGTPEANEADPSRMLAVVAPLLFGYMFGDVGHGLLLCLAGVWLQRRWPVVRLLIANGLAATVFGFVFGSVFGREDLIPALWLNPMEHPLPVLLVPLGGGVVILLTGLLLNALEFRWRGELRRWLLTGAPVVVLYLSIIAGFLLPHTAIIGMLAVLWYFSGSLAVAPGGWRSTLPGATGHLLESIFQLLVNTLSFVRVGAFALAHGGLSLAFLTLAAATDSPAAGLLILILGNAVVIMLEGLVVTIQTTRLILFEFFIRFLRCTGREFQPLAAPATLADMRREL
jgi:V/A-type H+-transporting ATPase subunit I